MYVKILNNFFHILVISIVLSSTLVSGTISAIDKDFFTIIKNTDLTKQSSNTDTKDGVSESQRSLDLFNNILSYKTQDVSFLNNRSNVKKAKMFLKEKGNFEMQKLKTIVALSVATQINTLKNEIELIALSLFLIAKQNSLNDQR